MNATKRPMFSIALAAYDSCDLLPRAIQSVLAQDRDDWELLIADDGSADETLAVAKAYASRDPRIKVFSQEHAGCGAARALAASHASGDFVTKLDADDELEPNALSVLADLIAREPGYDIYSATGVKVFSDETTAPFFRNPRFSRECSLTLDDLLDECFIFGGAATIRKETLERVGGFRPGVYCEDYDLWLRALARGAKHRMTPVSIYRYHFGTAGHMNEDPRKSLGSFIAIFSDLIASGVLDQADTLHAKRSIQRFKDSIDEYDAHGGVNAGTFTDRQARTFQDWAYRSFGERGGGAVMTVAERLKWLAKPVRLALARREIAKHEHEQAHPHYHESEPGRALPRDPEKPTDADTGEGSL